MKKINNEHFLKYTEELIEFAKIQKYGEEVKERIELHIRNQREDLIRQIVEATDTKNKKALARRVAIVANTLGWSNTDLHYLLKQRGEVKNFSAFLNWNLKLDKKV